METEDIWDFASRISAAVHKADAIRQKQAQIDGVSRKTCGNCDHWMKTSCVPEKVHRQFKSVSDQACGDFALSPSSAELLKKFTEEMQQIA
jgi:hypothetical protein